jgi:hypothetical protein
MVKKRNHNGLHKILRLNVNGALMIIGSASWIIFVPIWCRYSFIRYWQTVQAKTAATCSMRHDNGEGPRRVNNFSLRIFENVLFDLLQISVQQILLTSTGENNSAMLPAAG